jgi:ribosome-associated protein
MEEFKLNSPYITLGQLLKAADFIGTGGEQKEFLARAKVVINGMLDNRRGRKLVVGDIIKIGKREIQIT